MGKKRASQALLELARRDTDAFQKALADLSPQALEGLADVLEDEKLYRNAEFAYRALIEREPDNGRLHHALGVNLYYRQRDGERAESFLQQAMERIPDYADIALARATNLAWGLGRHGEALPILRAIVERAPEAADYRCVYAWCLLWVGEIELGLSEVRRSLASNRDLSDEVRLADHFYLYLFGDSETRLASLAALQKLVQRGVEAKDWDVSRLVTRARDAGHPEAGWLDKLVEVVSGATQASTLRSWSAWDAALHAPSEAARALSRLHAYKQAPPAPSLVVTPTRRDFLARYQAGEYQAWDDLVRHAVFVSQHPDVIAEAHAVAEALMRRVRHNADAVRATLQDAGASLAEEQAPARAEDIERLVAMTGPLPVALAAFWKIVGSVDLLPPSRRDADYGYGECSLESEGISLIALDPLSVYGLDAEHLLDEYEESWAESQAGDEVEPLIYYVAPDFLHKQQISGGPAYRIELPPTNVFDALDPDVLYEAHETTLVGYLRACFAYGGFPLLRVAGLPIDEIDLNDRVAFEQVKGPWGPPAERLRERLCRNTVAF